MPHLSECHTSTRMPSDAKPGSKAMRWERCMNAKRWETIKPSDAMGNQEAKRRDGNATRIPSDAMGTQHECKRCENRQCR
jgi:hypothetical protein